MSPLPLPPPPPGIPSVPSIEDPLAGFRFLVTLDPADAYLPAPQAALITLVASGGFQDVKGLGADLEVLPYPEGGTNDFVHQLPVRHSWTRISLKRGLVRDPGLYFWYRAGLTQSLGARRDGCIILLTPAGTAAVAWHFSAGLAVKWHGPELNAMQSSIAIEGIEIAHHGVVQVPLSSPGTL
jgi:phage tail-like protein